LIFTISDLTPFSCALTNPHCNLLRSSAVTLCTICFNIQRHYILFTQCIYVSPTLLTINNNLFSNRIKQLTLVMEMYVFCEVGTEILNSFTRILSFKRLLPLLLMSSHKYICPATNKNQDHCRSQNCSKTSRKFVYIKIHLVIFHVMTLCSLYVVTRMKHVGNYPSGHTVP
jgi:hypothetical protein